MLGTGYFLLLLAKQFSFCTAKFSQGMRFNLLVSAYRSMTKEKYLHCLHICTKALLQYS